MNPNAITLNVKVPHDDAALRVRLALGATRELLDRVLRRRLRQSELELVRDVAQGALTADQAAAVLWDLQQRGTEERTRVLLETHEWLTALDTPPPALEDAELDEEGLTLWPGIH